MASISVVIPHSLPQAEALERIKKLLDQVKTEQGDKIQDLQESWSNTEGTFSFTVKMFSVSGTLSVGQKDVVVNGTIPFAALFFKGTIEQTIWDKANELLSPPSQAAIGALPQPKVATVRINLPPIPARVGTVRINLPPRPTPGATIKIPAGPQPAAPAAQPVVNQTPPPAAPAAASPAPSTTPQAAPSGTTVQPAAPAGPPPLKPLAPLEPLAPLPSQTAPLQAGVATATATGGGPTQGAAQPGAVPTPPAGPAPLPQTPPVPVQTGPAANAQAGAAAGAPTGTAQTTTTMNFLVNGIEATWQPVTGATTYRSRLAYGGPTQTLDQFQTVPGSEVEGPGTSYKLNPVVVASVPDGNTIILLAGAYNNTDQPIKHGSVNVSFWKNPVIPATTGVRARRQQRQGATQAQTPTTELPWYQTTRWIVTGVFMATVVLCGLFYFLVLTPKVKVTAPSPAPVSRPRIVMESPAAIQTVAAPTPARVDRSNWLASFVPTRTTNILSTAEMLDRRTHVITRVVERYEKLELVHPADWLIEPLVYATVADFESAYNLGDLTSRQWVDYKMIVAPTTATTSSPTLASFGYQSFRDSSFVITFTCRPK